MGIWPLAAAVVSLPYRAALRLRNAYYDRLPAAVRRVAVPVISVGNLTVGGTGKTPVVVEVVRLLRSLGGSPVIVTRGYRAPPGGEADEVREFRLAVPDTPVVTDADRVRGAELGIARHGADCVVLDDGFQHRRLGRDLDLVTIDALDPWGGGWVLPAGRLREPRSSLRRADVVILTRANQVGADAERRLRREIAEVCVSSAAHARHGGASGASSIAVVAADLEAQAIVLPESRLAPEFLRGRRVLAVCGVGNPRSFELSLAALGADVASVQRYRDHHEYDTRDVSRLTAAAARLAVEMVVTTRKDWVKLSAYWRGQKVALSYLEVRLVVRDPASHLTNRLRDALERPR